MMPADPPFETAEVAAAFAAFPHPERAALLELRQRIFAVAARTPGVGQLQETLKWGEPAYLTAETKAGTTLRLGCPKAGGYALYVPCQTTIMSDARDQFGPLFDFDGNRAVHFATGSPPPEPVDLIIRHALTYKLARKAKA